MSLVSLANSLTGQFSHPSLTCSPVRTKGATKRGLCFWCGRASTFGAACRRASRRRPPTSWKRPVVSVAWQQGSQAPSFVLCTCCMILSGKLGCCWGCMPFVGALGVTTRLTRSWSERLRAHLQGHGDASLNRH